MERRRNTRTEETRLPPRENPSANCNVHDACHMKQSGRPRREWSPIRLGGRRVVWLLTPRPFYRLFTNILGPPISLTAPQQGRRRGCDVNQASPLSIIPGLPQEGGGSEAASAFGRLRGEEGGEDGGSPPTHTHTHARSRTAHIAGQLSATNYGVAPECKGGGNGRSPRKPADQRHRPARFPRAKFRSDPPGDRTRFTVMGGKQSARSALLRDISSGILAHEACMEQRRNEKDGGNGRSQENPLTGGIVLHDPHLRESGVNRPGIEPGSPSWEVSSLTAQSPWPPVVCRESYVHMKSTHVMQLIETLAYVRKVLGTNHGKDRIGKPYDQVYRPTREYDSPLDDVSIKLALRRARQVKKSDHGRWSSRLTGYGQSLRRRWHDGTQSRHCSELIYFVPDLALNPPECVFSTTTARLAEVALRLASARSLATLTEASRSTMQIQVTLSNGVLRADEGETRWIWSSTGMQRRGKRVIPEKTNRPVASSDTISECENPGATPPRAEPGLCWWEEDALTTAPTTAP
ncbi:hypothetical protein PR048_001053 [Dryococelus australis]|uniref:Uncharacterized protein n=1 Tax=Dryococelus australis TaxID=614101 RepID=A0ABQ9IH87_9NEOP|nr:hypothetical protein PR048_001053 [Dryococelus australis]